MSDVSAEFVENCGFELLRTGYTPPDGYRLLQIGEVVQKDDIFLAVDGEHWPAKRIGETVNNNRYIRRIEVENCGFEGKILREVSQPCAPCDSGDTGDTTTSEQLAEIEEQTKTVQVREGRWRTRGGEIRNVTPTPAGDGREYRFPWWDAQYRQTWAEDGRYHVRGESPLDLVKCLGPIEQQTEPQPQPQPEHLQAIIAAQAETIARLQSDVHELNMEIGGLQGNLSRRQARIRDLETLHAAASQAVVRADKANDKLREQLDAATAELQKRHPDHVGRAISTDEWMDQFARDASVSRLQADRNDLAGKVISLREQLQQANDRLAFLETLQPIAAACHTAQTMVRDMLGHMRCLLALQHTTDRRNFCTLLESILEVFDEAECDEDEDDDTTCTSEAGQG